MRRNHPGLVILALSLLVAATGPLLADQRPAGAPMTQKEFDALVQVARDGDTNVGAEPVHNPGKNGRKELAKEGAVKVIDGAEWSAMSPEQRRDRILELQRNGLSSEVDLVLVLPPGDVLAIPRAKRQMLTERGLIRPWQNSDYVELPTDRVTSQGKRGDLSPTSEPDEMP